MDRLEAITYFKEYKEDVPRVSDNLKYKDLAYKEDTWMVLRRNTRFGAIDLYFHHKHVVIATHLTGLATRSKTEFTKESLTSLHKDIEQYLFQKELEELG